MTAIAHADTVLEWRENLRQEDMPPEWMWPFDEEIEAWFEEVMLARENPDPDDRDEVPMMQNALTESRRG